MTRHAQAYSRENSRELSQPRRAWESSSGSNAPEIRIRLPTAIQYFTGDVIQCSVCAGRELCQHDAVPHIPFFRRGTSCFAEFESLSQWPRHWSSLVRSAHQQPFVAAASPDRRVSAAADSATGCLQKGDKPNTFKLVSKDGKSWDVTSSKLSLAGHVGHTVTLTGDMMKGQMSQMKDTSMSNMKMGDSRIGMGSSSGT